MALHAMRMCVVLAPCPPFPSGAGRSLGCRVIEVSPFDALTAAGIIQCLEGVHAVPHPPRPHREGPQVDPAEQGSKYFG